MNKDSRIQNVESESTVRSSKPANHFSANRDLGHDLVLPSILFMALGGMTWAVRGSSGFGAFNGCVFAGVTWGAAWWFIAREPSAVQSRRYSSGWIILALTLGIGISGNRGWMQWPSFFEGHLQLNYAQGKYVPISRVYGFIWLFIAGVPWAGLGACFLVWCAPARRLRALDWILRLSCGFGAAFLARYLFQQFPQVFLPLFDSLKDQYADPGANPNLRRLIGDNRAAIEHLGLYLGFLAYEAGRKDWKNVLLITTVGLVNGVGWAACQNWRWAAHLWPEANFNWWRCWESCGGISIGLAYGLAYYLVNRRKARRPARPSPPPRGRGNSEQQGRGSGDMCLPNAHPNLERFGVYVCLIFGLGLSVKNGLKGWANIYLGHEDYWNGVFWTVIGPAMIVAIVAVVVWIRIRPVIPASTKDIFPHDYRLMWLVLILQNLIAQLVTAPFSNWNEMAFKLYYLLLLIISGVIVYHLNRFKKEHRPMDGAEFSTA